MTDDDAKLLVERVGPLATIQDLGRPGWFDSGVGVAGAADRGALRLANRLVGNPEDHAGIEVLLGGVRLRTMRHTTLAVTGAPAPVTVDGRPVGHASVLELEPDQVVSLGLASTGLRSYIGVRGGIDVAPVLGSRSRDTMSGIGPDPLRPGDEVPIGPAPRTFPILDLAPLPNLPVLLDIRAVPGPRDDWFTDPAALFAGSWTVSADVDRVGARLRRESGPPLERSRTQELPTEGVALGAIQVPPAGQPVVFLADHPITGGYPVIAVVADADIDLMAQARPGQSVRFRRG
ncbi:biotin-dependent carboxyltransferase family protein [Nocardia cyriacigeorgica]|uniref:5-oxoprolinase subunit C family protein n=1 Tax=Nocardia cyriacigeorgica TaxID=135487 RepID=UPI000CE9B14C|nr:biotin-dependent carboxyltransferase family protein [Nocardia cyriacigeorgica]AVH21511.1 allophanate hydrolase [Nocardia cyriacigeorgica]MBF6320951.1 biotin-dependent carboxyltransferase family protein [Nocardia cyriacigeorgica]PPJ12375.1 allophanate hydrolase [Nocardia cyriacigeorgica]